MDQDEPQDSESGNNPPGILDSPGAGGSVIAEDFPAVVPGDAEASTPPTEVATPDTGSSSLAQNAAEASVGETAVDREVDDHVETDGVETDDNADASFVPVALALTEVEIRALGCLVEKEATTPDQYPLTTKGLVSACNQKSNRDPVVRVEEQQVDQAMLSLRAKELVRAVHQAGARTVKHRHTVDETWNLTQPQLAVVAVLCLRGPQTSGELRQRTERIHRFESIGEVDVVLQELAVRRPALVRELPREPGRRENRWIHLIGESQAASTHHDRGPAPSSVSRSPDSAASSEPQSPSTSRSGLSASDGSVVPGAADRRPAPSSSDGDASDASDADPTVPTPRPVVTSAGARPPKPPSATAVEVEELRHRVASLEASIVTLQEKLAALTGP